MIRMILAASLAAMALSGAGIASAATPSVVKPTQTHTMNCRYDGTVGGILVYNLTGRVLPLDAIVRVRLTYGARYPHVKTASFRIRENVGGTAIPAGSVARFKSGERGFRHCSATVTLAGHFAR